MSTKISNIIILLTMVYGATIGEAAIDPLHGLADQIYRDYCPNQVTIFVNKTEEFSASYHHNIAMKKIIQMNPSAIINLARFNVTDLNQTITYTSIQKNPRFFISMNHKVIRPKILLFYFSKESDDEEVIQAFVDIMRFAWNCEFLDFSIVQLIFQNEIDAYLYQYNPFFNTFTKSTYNTSNDLFVDKLRDVNLHPIRIMLSNQPPFLQFSLDKGKHKIQGLHFQLLKIASQKMNFEIKYVLSNVKALAHTSVNEDSLNRLAQGHVDVLGVALSFVQSKCAKMSVGLIYYEDMVAIVPIVRYTCFHIPVNMLVYLFLIPTITVSLVRLSVYLRILSIDPGVFNVIRTLYGIPTGQPRKFVDRIIFFSIVFISMQYSMSYYSRLMDGQMLRQEMSFASFRDIADSPMDIFINRKYADRYLPIEDPDARRIKARVTPLDDILECVKNLDSRSVICMASEYYAKYVEATRLNSKGRPLVKVAPVSFSKELVVFYTKDAFPYAEKFQEIFQRIYEAGIWPSPFTGEKMMMNNGTKSGIEVDQEKGQIIHQIGFMLIAGFSMAFLAFVWEMMR